MEPLTQDHGEEVEVFLKIAGVVIAAATIPLTSPTAQSATDTTPPTLRAPVKASFTVGSQIPLGAPQDCGDDAWDLRLWVEENFKWRGSDDSGVVRYDLAEETGANGVEDIFLDSTQTSSAGLIGTNTDQTCGGGNWSAIRWILTASDPAGNMTTRDIYGGRIRLT